MKFFDLELGSSLATARKKKGGTRDVFFMPMAGHTGCHISWYTNSAGNSVSIEDCNITGEWHVMYGYSYNCEELSR